MYKSGIIECEVKEELNTLGLYVPTYRVTELTPLGKLAYNELDGYGACKRVIVHSYEGCVDLTEECTVEEMVIYSPEVSLIVYMSAVSISKLKVLRDMTLYVCDTDNDRILLGGIYLKTSYASFRHLHLGIKTPSVVGFYDDVDTLLNIVRPTKEKIIYNPSTDDFAGEVQIANRLGVPILLRGYNMEFVDLLLKDPEGKYITWYTFVHLLTILEEYYVDLDVEEYLTARKNQSYTEIGVLADIYNIEDAELEDYYSGVFCNIPCSDGNRYDIFMLYDSERAYSNGISDRCAYVKRFLSK